ncbi:MAG: ABC transporter substrate-binding protein [Pseudomonadales bacterium]
MEQKSKALMTWLVAILLTIPLQAVGADRQLVLLNWDEYLDAELVQRFERQYGAEIIQILYSSEEDRTAKLVASNGVGYDLILSSGIDLGSYVKRGWLAAINEEKLPNLKYIDPALRAAFPDAKAYGLPYFWGTLGILYRSDLVQTPITSWTQLFKPTPDLQGKISMVEDGRDLISMGLKALGYSANSTNRSQLKAVESLLLAQKPFVKSYLTLTLDAGSPLVSGEISASMSYSGDALMVEKHNANLTYVLPEEGGNIWIDYFTISANARDPELAYLFLNFINEPENAAQLAQFLHYATPNKEAEELLPDNFLTDPSIYPASKQLEKSEFYKPLPARAQRKRNQIMTRVLR